MPQHDREIPEDQHFPSRSAADRAAVLLETVAELLRSADDLPKEIVAQRDIAGPASSLTVTLTVRRLCGDVATPVA
jgi:hypothetical protein